MTRSFGHTPCRWAALPIGEGPSVAELVRSSPGTGIATLQCSGVQEVAHFCLPDKLVLGRLGDDKIATLGAQHAELDYEAAWRQELGPCCPDDAHATDSIGNSRKRSAPSGGSSAREQEAGTGQEWCSDVPVVAYVVSVRDAAAPGARGLLRPLIRRWQAGGCSAATFQLPVVQAAVDWKWQFCRRLLLGELALFLAWVACAFAFALVHPADDSELSLAQLLASGRGQLAVAAELGSLAAMAPFLYIELCAAVAYGAGFWDLWLLLDLATYALQFGIAVLHLGRLALGAQVIPVAAATQCVLLLFRLQFFSSVFPATRFAFIEDIKEVLHDMKWFLLFLVLVMAGFATAFVVLFRPDAAAGRSKKEFAGVGHSLITMLSWVAGDPNLTLLYGEDVSHPLAACLLGAAYIFCFTLVLTTLLISLMTNTLQKVAHDEAARMLLSKALIIDELESTIPGLLACMWPQTHPRYLHVLRIDPDKLDVVRLDQLWKSLSDEEEAHLAQGPSAISSAQPPTAAAAGGSDKAVGSSPFPGQQSASASTAEPAQPGSWHHVASPASSADVAAVRREVRELRQLVLEAIGKLHQ